MRARLLTRLAAAGTAVVCAAAPAPSTAAELHGPAGEIFRDYSADGRIGACEHSSADLRRVQRTMPPDIEQYASDYPLAVAGALASRARGDCLPPKPTATPATTAAPTVAPEVAAPPAPGASPASTSPPDVLLDRVAATQPANTAPAPLIVLVVLGGLLAGLALVVLAMRRSRLGEERLERASHAWREASWRAGGAWEDFRDWLRLGR